MAGKTLINGTAYGISGGKTLIKGTAYRIAGGKALVNGTAYDISFGADLTELFGGMTILSAYGHNSGSADTLNVYFPSDAAAGDSAYVFCFCGGSMSISKVIYGSSGCEELYYGPSGSYAPGSEPAAKIYYPGGGTISYSEDGTRADNLRGGFLLLAKFEMADSIVDSAFRGLEMVYSAGNDSGSTSTERIIKSSISDGCYIFVASYKSGNDFAINYYDGSTVQNIISSRAANTFLYDDGSQLWYSKYGDSATSGRPTLHVVM